MKTSTSPDELFAHLRRVVTQVALLIALACLVPGVARAEPCRTIGGCAGKVWLIHVPQRQISTGAVFQAAGLPAAGRTEILRDDVALLPPEIFAGRYVQQLTDALEKQQSEKQLLSGFGNSLQKGMKVRILSYQTFPNLGRMAGELFVIVLVLTE